MSIDAVLARISNGRVTYEEAIQHDGLMFSGNIPAAPISTPLDALIHNVYLGGDNLEVVPAIFDGERWAHREKGTRLLHLKNGVFVKGWRFSDAG